MNNFINILWMCYNTCKFLSKWKQKHNLKKSKLEDTCVFTELRLEVYMSQKSPAFEPWVCSHSQDASHKETLSQVHFIYWDRSTANWTRFRDLQPAIDALHVKWMTATHFLVSLKIFGIQTNGAIFRLWYNMLRFHSFNSTAFYRLYAASTFFLRLWSQIIWVTGIAFPLCPFLCWHLIRKINFIATIVILRNRKQLMLKNIHIRKKIF